MEGLLLHRRLLIFSSLDEEGLVEKSGRHRKPCPRFYNVRLVFWIRSEISRKCLSTVHFRASTTHPKIQATVFEHQRWETFLNSSCKTVLSNCCISKTSPKILIKSLKIPNSLELQSFCSERDHTEYPLGIGHSAWIRIRTIDHSTLVSYYSPHALSTRTFHKSHCSGDSKTSQIALPHKPHFAFFFLRK